MWSSLLDSKNSTRSYRHLEPTLDIIKKENKTVCLCGDFNINLLDTTDFPSFMFNYQFFPCINRPTRIFYTTSTPKKTSTLINQFWIKPVASMQAVDFKSAILVDSFNTDHLAICCCFKIEKNSCSTTCFEFCKSDVQHAEKLLAKQSWTIPFNFSANELFRSFRKKLSSAFTEIQLKPKLFNFSWQNGEELKEQIQSLQSLHEENLLVQTNFLLDPTSENAIEQRNNQIILDEKVKEWTKYASQANKTRRITELEKKKLHEMKTQIAKIKNTEAENLDEVSFKKQKNLTLSIKLWLEKKKKASVSQCRTVFESIYFSNDCIAVPDNFGSSLSSYEQAIPGIYFLLCDKKGNEEKLSLLKNPVMLFPKDMDSANFQQHFHPFYMLLFSLSFKIRENISNFLDHVIDCSLKNGDYLRSFEKFNLKKNSELAPKQTLFPFFMLLEHEATKRLLRDIKIFKETDLSSLRYPDNCPNGHNPERHNPEGHNPEWTQSRMDTIPNGHNPEWTQSRMDTIPNGHNPEWTPSRMDTIPNGHHPEWTPSRMDTIPNGHNPEWTQSRMDTIPNGHHPEWTQSRMDTIPNGHNPEWTQSRMDTIPNGHNPERTQSRMDTIPNGHNPEWTPSRMDTIPNGHNPEWTQSRMDTIPKGHHPEWTQSRMDTIPNGHNPEWTQSRMDTIPNGHNPEWTQSRMDTIPNGHNPEWTQSRMDTIPNGHNPEWTQSRMDTIPNGHHPEWTQSRMDTIPNGHNPEWTQSRKDTIPNGHHPEWTQSRMDTIPNGHNPERTQSRMDTIPKDTIPKGHNPEWTQSRMDTIPKGHHPEWTQSRKDTIPNEHLQLYSYFGV